MTFVRKATILAATGLIAGLSYAPQSAASSAYNNGSKSTATGYTSQAASSATTYNAGPTSYLFQDTILDGSITATQFYKAGIRRFNKGKFDKAEESFKAVLRANGLNKQAYFYLAKIKEQQGDSEKANEYAKAYFSVE